MSLFNRSKPKGPQYFKTTIEVTCPDCHETYNIRTDQHMYTRNCRCSKGSFEIQLGTGYNHITVNYINSVGTKTKFTNFRIIAQKA